jgi:putative ABC transport system permease protein
MGAWLTDLSLALRNVLRHRRRSAMACGAVAFGVIAVILANSFIEWVMWAMRETTIRSQFGHVQVSREGYAERGTAEPLEFLIDPASPIREQLRALPYVRAVAPRISFSGLLSHGEATVSFIGEGVDPLQEAAIQSSLKLPRAAINIVSGQDLSADEPMGLVLGEGLAASIGVRVGDKVVLLASAPGGGVNGIEGRVRGTFSTISKAFDDAALRLNRAAAHELLRVTGDHRLVVLLERTELTAQAAADLRGRLAGRGVEVTAWQELADFYNKTAELFGKQTAFVQIVIALIIVLSITNTMMMSVFERTNEIGTAMALGMPRARILRQFLLEGAALGALGGALGIAAGTLLARGISKLGIPMPPPPGQSWGYLGEMLVTPSIQAQAFALALTTALAASAYPAFKASRQTIVDALRTNR